MIATVDLLTEKLMDVKYNRIPQGLGLGTPEIDEHIRWKRNSFDVVVGHANTGKTTTIIYMMTAFAVKHNLKWLVFSSENTPYSIARKILEFKTGKPINQLSDEVIREQMVWIDNHFKIMEFDKLYTAESLLEEAMQIKFEQFDFDGFLIDPYNSLTKDSNLMRKVGGHEYDYQIASKMRMFCDKLDVSILLNTHAVTEALRRVHPKGHQYEGLPVPPSMADVEGGGKWGNRANQVYTVHRYVQSPTDWMISEIHVRKVKEVESGGRPTSIDSPVCLRMMPGSCGFTYAGMDVMPKAAPELDYEPELDF
jgi:hypothetical protein